MTTVELGFAEKCAPWRVSSRLFPSKIGGKPAWLDLENLPSPETLKCETCEKPMLFLLQVYAPYEDDDCNFHRTIYMFVCRNAACCQNNSSANLKVFRSALRRDNRFYSFEPPEDAPDLEFTLTKWVKLCQFCGCIGEKNCSKCKSMIYCCRDHQVLDWEEHKNYCGRETEQPSSSKLFPEFEIVTEMEVIKKDTVNEAKEMKIFEQLKKEGKLGTLSDVSESELHNNATADEDKVFSQFRKRIELNREQILRYSKGGEVLWIASHPKPDNVPNCEYCGGRRRFEFQVMPQMLSVLHENELDWGILAIYTCIKSCVDGPSYKKEFVYKQDV